VLLPAGDEAGQGHRDQGINAPNNQVAHEKAIIEPNESVHLTSPLVTIAPEAIKVAMHVTPGP
jgi:hypothetical protein